MPRFRAPPALLPLALALLASSGVIRAVQSRLTYIPLSADGGGEGELSQPGEDTSQPLSKNQHAPSWHPRRNRARSFSAPPPRPPPRSLHPPAPPGSPGTPSSHPPPNVPAPPHADEGDGGTIAQNSSGVEDADADSKKIIRRRRDLGPSMWRELCLRSSDRGALGHNHEDDARAYAAERRDVSPALDTNAELSTPEYLFTLPTEALRRGVTAPGGPRFAKLIAKLDAGEPIKVVSLGREGGLH